MAGQIAKELTAIGAEVFIDVLDLETGDDFDERIRSELETSDELLVLLSPPSVMRPNVWMEVGAAWGRGVRIACILHGMTVSELLQRDGTPATVKRVHLRELNNFDAYLDELRRRLAT